MHRGVEPKGPKRLMIASERRKPGTFPNLPKKWRWLPSKRIIAITPAIGMIAAVKINPKEAKSVLSPENWPTAKGKTMFPAPKNMEKRASPIERDLDLKIFFIISSFAKSF